VKSPVGFGKNYFSFTAVLAYSVQRSLNAKASSIYSLLSNEFSREAKEEDDDELPLEILETTCLTSDRPCHCNCIYKIKTRLATLLYHYIPRCPYYCTYFAFRRTGVHPPLA